MASFLIIFINLFLSMLVIGGILGSHLWAITTQHRDWPVGLASDTGRRESILTRVLSVEVAPGLALS